VVCLNGVEHIGFGRVRLQGLKALGGNEQAAEFGGGEGELGDSGKRITEADVSDQSILLVFGSGKPATMPAPSRSMAG